MKGLTIEQMELLASKGFDAAEMIAFAKMGAVKSKGAQRTARWRARKNGAATESVTCDGHGDASPPPIEEFIPPVSSNDETKARPKKPSQSTPAKPDDVSEPVWVAFTALRRKKGGLSDVALAGIRRESVKAGWTMEAALARCVERNWQGFEAEWVEPRSGSPPAAANDYLASLTAKRAARERQDAR